MKQQYLRTIYFLVFLVSPSLLLAADESSPENIKMQMDGKEQQSADKNSYQVTSPVVGFSPLTVGGEQIDAAYIEESYGERKGVVVLFHDQGEQFESNGVITPLRHALPEFGWSTLSISLDLSFESNILLSARLEKMESGDEAEPVKTPQPVLNEQRIAAALSFLKGKDFERIIFIGHGQGGGLAFESLQNNSENIAALVLISTAEIAKQEEFNLLELPILDVLGSRDLTGIEQAVAQRKVMMKRNSEANYTARKIIGANHVYYGLEPMLISTLRGWLKTQFDQQGQN